MLFSDTSSFRIFLIEQLLEDIFVSKAVLEAALLGGRESVPRVDCQDLKKAVPPVLHLFFEITSILERIFQQ